MLGIEDDHHRFETAQDFVFAPGFGKIDHGFDDIALACGEKLFEHIEQIERIRRRAGETGEDLPLMEFADLRRIVFEYRMAECYLPVAADDSFSAAFVGEYRCGVEHYSGTIFRCSVA